MRTVLRFSFLLSDISSTPGSALKRRTSEIALCAGKKVECLTLSRHPRQNCHMPRCGGALAKRKVMEAVAMIGHAPSRPIRESRRQSAVHALCPRFQMIRAGRRLCSFGAHLHAARHAKWIDHHHGKRSPGPVSLPLTPAAWFDRKQLAGPKIEDGDVFQVPPFR